MAEKERVYPPQTWMEHEDWEEGRGHWLETYSGRRFFPLDPRPEDVDLASIAWATARMCRYGGHVLHFWSVADHEWALWRYASEEDGVRDARLLRTLLLHDGAEAYILDLIRSLKMALRSCYKPIEEAVEAVIWQKYDLSSDPADLRYMKELDRRIVRHERQHLFTPRRDRNAWAADNYEWLSPLMDRLVVSPGGTEVSFGRYWVALQSDPVLRTFILEGE